MNTNAKINRATQAFRLAPNPRIAAPILARMKNPTIRPTKRSAPLPVSLRRSTTVSVSMVALLIHLCWCFEVFNASFESAYLGFEVGDPSLDRLLVNSLVELS